MEVEITHLMAGVEAERKAVGQGPGLFFFFWLHLVFIAVRGLSLVALSEGYSSLWCAGFSLRWLLLSRSTGSRCAGFSSSGTRVQ